MAGGNDVGQCAWGMLKIFLYVFCGLFVVVVGGSVGMIVGGTYVKKDHNAGGIVMIVFGSIGLALFVIISAYCCWTNCCKKDRAGRYVATAPIPITVPSSV